MLFPADRIAFVYGAPGDPITVPPITVFDLFAEEVCTTPVEALHPETFAPMGTNVSTDVDALIQEFRVEALRRVWARPRVVGAAAFPLDASFADRIDALDVAVGVTDHGDLTGLDDDDHPQYLTEDRGDARYPTRIEAADYASASALGDETTARQQSDGVLSQAITAETTARQQADQALQQGLDGKAPSGHSHSISGVTGLTDVLAAKASAQSVTDEATARQQADTALQQAVDGKASASALGAETTARQQADEALQGDIDTRALQEDLAAEASARTGADSDLQADIATRALQSSLDAEADARTAADEALQQSVTNEATARTQADADLQADVDGKAAAEHDHIVGDITGLADDLAAKASAQALADEATARQDADEALQADLAAKADAQHSHTLAQVDSSGATAGQVATADGAGGTTWENPTGGGGGGVTDHGDLTGLEDDDHTQYALADGTRGAFATPAALAAEADAREAADEALQADIDGRALTEHTHPIGDIEATGTPSNSTFLRGDGTWSTPAGGGGGEPPDLSDYYTKAQVDAIVEDSVTSTDVSTIVSLTQAAYDSLGTPDPTTLYVIVG